LKKAVSTSEQLLERLQAQQQQLENQLADNTLYEPANKDQLTQLLAQKAQTDRQLEDAELEWLRAVDALENAELDAID
jgi:ATP-binding cassette subfamily F protein 3